MKVIFFIALVSMVWYPSGDSERNNPASIQRDTSHDSIVFEKDIQPILEKHCIPCHFTGGKMYDRLPFDKASSILKPDAQPGILKRIKDEQEKEIIRSFIKENSKP